MNSIQRLYFLIAVVFIISISGCADSVSDLNTDDVSITVDSEDLNIKNNFNHSIYYFAVEAGVAAVIQWAPISSDENRVKSRSTKRILLENIHAYEPGDEILIYYWSKKEPGNKNIKFQRIQTQ